jgi:hypothetical protein
MEGEVVDSDRIEALLSALDSPPLSAPSATNLGITPEWLNQNVGEPPRNGAPNQRALFKQTFTDLKAIEGLLPYAFMLERLDDAPHIQITVTFEDGDRWDASSDPIRPLMLPWRVNLNGKEQPTFNANISRSLAALMPNGSLNRDRLNDEELVFELRDNVMFHVAAQWDLLDIENRAPDSFSTLRQSFEVQRARINDHRSVDFGYNGNDPRPREENLSATLRKSSLPPFLTEEVVLLYRDGKIEGVAELPERIAPYERLALSVPWLKTYLASHPKQNMYIRFVHDRSLSSKAMQNFAADMKKMGKESLAAEASAVQDKVALIFLDYGSDWLILPDKRMILWRHYLPATFMKWSANDFKFARCADYNANNGGCVGVVISPEGKLFP